MHYEERNAFSESILIERPCIQFSESLVETHEKENAVSDVVEHALIGFSELDALSRFEGHSSFDKMNIHCIEILFEQPRLKFLKRFVISFEIHLP